MRTNSKGLCNVYTLVYSVYTWGSKGCPHSKLMRYSVVAAIGTPNSPYNLLVTLYSDLVAPQLFH